jgi:hypothetical protein
MHYSISKGVPMWHALIVIAVVVVVGLIVVTILKKF